MRAFSPCQPWAIDLAGVSSIGHREVETIRRLTATQIHVMGASLYGADLLQADK
jgi:hypothetical protein